MAHTEREVFESAAQGNDKKTSDSYMSIPRDEINMTAPDEIKIEADKDKEAITRAITEAVTKFFMKNIENIFAAPGQKVSEPDKEIPIYEKLSPGEVFIISRSNRGVLVAANCDGECDIRYYNEE